MLGLGGFRLYVGLGLVLAIIGLFATVTVLRSRLEAKTAEIAGLSRQLSVATDDAARWQAAAAQRQGVIDRQALTLRRLESDGAAARRIAAANAEQADRRIAALESKLSQLKEAAHARPDDVRPLGPIVRGFLQSGSLGGLRH
jgi:hypothetical protein